MCTVRCDTCVRISMTFLQPKIATGFEHCSCKRCVFDNSLVVTTTVDIERYLEPNDWTEVDDKAREAVCRTVGMKSSMDGIHHLGPEW